ncbi:oligopeptidase B [Chondrocystis sp. NIES-4102]|nr:oligopeptidase B [Chondrocystis sp. NIES-4102]
MTDRQKLVPPIAQKQPHTHLIHGDERADNYYWLRDRDNDAVTDYLEAENQYTEAMMAHTESLQANLYKEMLSRIQETDLSVPSRKDNYYYYSRTEEGKAYSIYCRKENSLDAPEEILLDQNQLAEKQDYFSLGVLAVSPNHQILAYSIDTTGAEKYTLYFKDLNTQEVYPQSIPDTYYSFAWANDNQTVFYTKVDSANRPDRLFRHNVNQGSEHDVLIHHETDEAYFLSVGKTSSDAYIILNLGSIMTSEIHFLDANSPTNSFQVFQGRVTGIEYSLTHHGDYFYITTNEGAINFKLMKTPVNKIDKENWQEVIPHREEIYLLGVDAFIDHLIIYEQEEGVPKLRVHKFSTEEEHYIAFPEPVYSAGDAGNPEYDTNIFRFSYTSLATPNSIYDYNLDTQDRELKKETPVLGGYDRNQYISQRLYATAEDGAVIPISVVYKKGIEKNRKNPCFLTAYGSYGVNYPVYFSSTRLSLLERGVIFAIAHIRGGSEKGRKWYQNGKLLAKKNTFTDFITCAEYLIKEQWTNNQQLAISGGSAGGLLMGAVLNMRPDLFKAAIANVPFVDVVTTILDPSLPLTVTEWEEWGNPQNKSDYDYMKSYSPYDNVTEQNYPHLLITAGLNDPRVAYWEPAKWTAKLRTLKTDDNLLLLKTNMDAGHGGASGRYEQLKETAFEYAFLLDLWGLN